MAIRTRRRTSRGRPSRRSYRSYSRRGRPSRVRGRRRTSSRRRTARRIPIGFRL